MEATLDNLTVMEGRIRPAQVADLIIALDEYLTDDNYRDDPILHEFVDRCARIAERVK
jgi:hypothetical protein